MRPIACLFIVAAAFSVGGCAVPVGVTVASYAADGALMVATDKTSTDHLLSMAAGQDCAMWRVVKDRAICTARKPGDENPYDVDFDAPHREADEGGMVSVYSAPRDGGRLLSDSEAKVAMASRPVPMTPSEPPSASAAAGDGQVPPILLADVQWTDDAAPSTVAAKPVVPVVRRQPPVRGATGHTGRSGGKKAVAPGRQAIPVAKRSTAQRTVATRQPAKRHLAERDKAGRGPVVHGPVAIASATP